MTRLLLFPLRLLGPGLAVLALMACFAFVAAAVVSYLAFNWPWERACT